MLSVIADMLDKALTPTHMLVVVSEALVKIHRRFNNSCYLHDISTI
jgi:hypothetical protein